MFLGIAANWKHTDIVNVVKLLLWTCEQTAAWLQKQLLWRIISFYLEPRLRPPDEHQPDMNRPLTFGFESR